MRRELKSIYGGTGCHLERIEGTLNCFAGMHADLQCFIIIMTVLVIIMTVLVIIVLVLVFVIIVITLTTRTCQIALEPYFPFQAPFPQVKLRLRRLLALQLLRLLADP